MSKRHQILDSFKAKRTQSEFWLNCLLYGCLGVAFLPITLWIANTANEQSRILHALIVLVMAIFTLALYTRIDVTEPLTLNSSARKTLLTAYGLLVLSALSPSIIPPSSSLLRIIGDLLVIPAYCCGLASAVLFIFGRDLKRITYTATGTFCAFMLLSILMEPLDWPLRTLADKWSLVQMLKKGHHGVELEPEAWERVYAWIDLNTPCWGTWGEATERKEIPQKDRRLSILKSYAGVEMDDPETIYPVTYTPQNPRPKTELTEQPATDVTCEGWPFNAAEAARRQAAGGPSHRDVTLPGYGAIRLQRIPAGQFVMGDPKGHPADRDLQAVNIESDFWMSATEVTNALYHLFDEAHDSRLEPGDNSPFYKEDIGAPCNEPNQPVVRISQQRAVAFCEWLSEQTGKTFRLPTEAEWEVACRAGSASPMWWGETDADFTAYANLADRQLGKERGIYGGKSVRVPSWRPAEMELDDGHHVSAPVGSFAANAWGLYDMHGNVAEWTSSSVAGGQGDLRIIRGGSWYNLPKLATAGHRMSYPKWQPVYDVGFRVVMVDE